MKTFVFISFLLSIQSVFAFNGPDQVIEEFLEGGHIPQGLKPVVYKDLDSVISKDEQIKIKAHKAKKKKQKKLIKEQIPAQDPGVELLTEDEEISNQAINLPESVDLRKWDSYVHSQWNGTCTAHGLTSSIENLMNHENKGQDLSVRFFWSTYRQYSAVKAMQTAVKVDQIPEEFWPQTSLKPKASRDDLFNFGVVRLKKASYLNDDIDKVVRALAQGFPVYVAMSVPADMASGRSSIRPTTRVTSGGHALSVVGYRLSSSVSGGGYLILKNSWGSAIGDRGYQYLPFSLCGRSDMYCDFFSIEGLEYK